MPRIWLSRILSILGTILLTLLPNSATPQQALQPRASGNKLSLPEMQAMPPVNRIVIKFREGSQVRLRDGRLFSATTADVAANVENVIRQTGVAAPELKRLHTLPEATLDAQREEAQRRSGRELADLNLYYVLELPITANAAEIADRLNALPNVEFAEPEPVPAPPPSGTPNLTGTQGYKNAPPQGIGVLDPIVAPGSDGKGITLSMSSTVGRSTTKISNCLRRAISIRRPRRSIRSIVPIMARRCSDRLWPKKTTMA